jgi:hypothetical protein
VLSVVARIGQNRARSDERSGLARASGIGHPERLWG